MQLKLGELELVLQFLQLFLVMCLERFDLSQGLLLCSVLFLCYLSVLISQFLFNILLLKEYDHLLVLDFEHGLLGF